MNFTYLKKITVVLIHSVMDFTVLKNLQVRESRDGGFSKLPSKVKKIYLNTKQGKRIPTLDHLDRMSQIRFRRHYIPPGK